MKNEINEMAEFILSEMENSINERAERISSKTLAKALYAAGYRKQSDVVKEFAEAFGISVSTVHFWCDRDVPTYKDMKRLARWLGWRLETVEEYFN